MRRGARATGALCATLLSVPSLAQAEEPRLTLSVDLLELLPPTTVALTTELPLGHRVSLAGTTAAGVRSIAGGGSTTAWTAMLAPRWYVLGRVAEGLHVDVALAYARAVGGPLQGDLQPPAGASVGPVVGYETRPFTDPAARPLVLGVELGLLHAVWTAPEAGGVASLGVVVPWGEVTVGLSF